MSVHEPQSPAHELDTIDGADTTPSSTNQEDVRVNDNLPPTDRGRGAYLALACCTAAQVPIWGYAVSFGIFQNYYTKTAAFDASTGAIATVGALQMGVMYLMMPIAFVLLYRYPQLRRWCGPLGLALTVLSLCASAFVRDIGGLIATQGALYAVGCGLLFSPVSMYMDEWWDKRKGFAYGVMWAGKATVGVAMPFVFDTLLQRYSLRATLLAWTVASALMTLPTLLFLKPRIPLRSRSQTQALSFVFLKHASFWMMLIGIVLQASGYMMPSTYIASYASAVGLPSAAGPILLSLFSLASVPGAVIFGMLGDRLTATKVILISSLGSAVSVFLLWGLSRRLAAVIVFVLFYGFFAGGFSSTWASVLHRIKREDAATDTSIVFGLLLGGRGLGFVLGGPLSGALLSAKSHLAGGALGYGTAYGPMVLFTGVTAVFGAWVSFWTMGSILRSRGLPRPRLLW